MLPKHISTSKDYEDFLDAEFNNLPASVRERLLHDEELKHMRRQMISFRPEFAQEIIASCYSKTGRRGMDPVIIIRSLLLMLAYGCLSITKWVRKVKADIALQFLIGFWKIPSIGSHYFTRKGRSQDRARRRQKVQPKAARSAGKTTSATTTMKTAKK